MDDNTYYTPDYSGYYFTIFVFWFIFSCAVSAVANKKGNSGLAAFFISIMLSPLVGIVLVLASKTNVEVLEKEQIKSGKGMQCPYCAEIIKAEARCCRFCGKDVLPNTTDYQARTENDNQWNWFSPEQSLPAARVVRQPLPVARIPANTFKISKDGVKWTELNIEEICNLINAKELTFDDYFWDVSSNDWIPLRQHPEIA